MVLSGFLLVSVLCGSCLTFNVRPKGDADARGWPALDEAIAFFPAGKFARVVVAHEADDFTAQPARFAVAEREHDGAADSARLLVPAWAVEAILGLLRSVLEGLEVFPFERDEERPNQVPRANARHPSLFGRAIYARIIFGFHW